MVPPKIAGYDGDCRQEETGSDDHGLRHEGVGDSDGDCADEDQDDDDDGDDDDDDAKMMMMMQQRS